MDKPIRIWTEIQRLRGDSSSRAVYFRRHIVPDIAKNDRSVQRLRPFHDNAAERSFLTVP
jgi:hypothetical protein